MSYADHARRFLDGRPRHPAIEPSVDERNERNEVRDATLPLSRPAEQTVDRMAAEILAFTAEELTAYRAELAYFPPDDPPSELELDALALADVLRAERIGGTPA